ncbi:hypothetical protein [Enterobacter hormaechei]
MNVMNMLNSPDGERVVWAGWWWLRQRLDALEHVPCAVRCAAAILLLIMLHSIKEMEKHKVVKSLLTMNSLSSFR